jgi:hypothetical protein
MYLVQNHHEHTPLLMTVMGANPGPRSRKSAEKALDAAISGAPSMAV